MTLKIKLCKKSKNQKTDAEPITAIKEEIGQPTEIEQPNEIEPAIEPVIMEHQRKQKKQKQE